MQIKYRITFAYAITVAFILLMLCASIFYFSRRDRITIFRDRLEGRAESILHLLEVERMPPALLQKVNSTSPASLTQKSIQIIAAKGGSLVFQDKDEGAEAVIAPARLMQKAKKGTPYFFTQGKRDCVLLKGNEHTVVFAALDNDRADWLEKLSSIIFVCFVGGIAIVIVVGYIFSLQLVRTIGDMSNKLRHITSKDLTLRLRKRGSKDELQQLSENINSLLERLQHSFETQSRFIDNASHELATPLAVIISQLDVAQQKNRSNEEYRMLTASIREDALRLDKLVKSLLDLSKISGKSGIELAPFSIADMLIALPTEIARISPEYTVHQHFEEFPEDDAMMAVFGNEALLFSAFYNIAHNACKFSAYSEAFVSLSFVDGKIVVGIRDNGTGIPPQDIDKIFNPFYRTEQTDEPGNGLGLTLAQSIVALHHGKIKVNSVLGQGTTFVVTLTPMSVQA